MKILSRDTPPQIERIQIERLRQMPTWRKLQLAADGTGRAVRTPALAGLRQRHPDNTPSQRHRRLAGLLLGTNWPPASMVPLRMPARDRRANRHHPAGTPPVAPVG